MKITTQGVNLVLTGVMAISGIITAVPHPTNMEPQRDQAEIAQPIQKRVSETPVKADSNVKLGFDRPSVTSIPKPKPKPEPKKQPITLVTASVKPEAASSKNFNVEKTLQMAESEVGKTFPTGWDQPGECIVAAQRWIHAGGGNWYGGGTPTGNYVNAAVVTYENAAPGDIIQYLSLQSPSSWVTGVHTVLVTKNNGDGTLGIIEANNPGGSGLVSENKKWIPTPPEGFEAKVFRF